MKLKWYTRKDGDDAEKGPFTKAALIEAVKGGVLGRHTLVRREDQEDASAIQDHPSFKALGRGGRTIDNEVGAPVSRPDRREPAAMSSRPTSVTVVCWLEIVFASFAMISFLVARNSPQVEKLMRKNDLFLFVQYAVGLHGVQRATGFHQALLMNVVCAIAMLNGKKWARQIFFGWMCLSVLVTFAISRTPLPLMIIPGVLFQSVLLVFLFRSEATVYFSGKPAMEP